MGRSNAKDMLVSLTLDNEYLELVNEFVYLGVKFVSGKVFCTNADVQRRKFFASVKQSYLSGQRSI